MGNGHLVSHFNLLIINSMFKRKSFWISLCLGNLCIVAFLGFCLRSKILFPLGFMNYRYFLSAHSHFAFAGWAGLGLITLMIFDLLPAERYRKRFYLWVLAAIEVSSLGMVFTFPFYGYNTASILFSTLYIVATVAFAPVFIKDILGSLQSKIVRALSISAVTSLLISFIGTLGLIYILSGKSTDAILYRDSIYTFLHFEYNGFFTLSVFALFFNYTARKNILPSKDASKFTFLLCLSIIPSLFLSLLWHNSVLFYSIAGIGSVLILISLYYLLRYYRSIQSLQIFTRRLSATFVLFAFLSFCVKMILNVGTIYPALGNAVYGDRPVIIGFLHLVFLGFLSFYLLSTFIEKNYFTSGGNLIRSPFYLFASGIFLNETLLMLQGLGILFNTNHTIFSWLLWAAAFILFIGSLFLLLSRLYVVQKNKP